MVFLLVVDHSELQVLPLVHPSSGPFELVVPHSQSLSSLWKLYEDSTKTSSRLLDS